MVFSFLFGVVFGSFLNVLIYRLPKNISLIKSSSCPNCSHKINWYENIPLFSYLYLKAKCSSCKTTINYRYFFVELMCGLLTLLLYIDFSFTLDFFLYALFFYILIVLSFIDIEYKAVPDYLLIIIFIFSFFCTNYPFFQALKNACLFAGFFILLDFILSFYIQNIKYKLLKDIKLKTQKALGEGDIPIISIIGIILGLKAGIVAIFLAGIFAIIPSIYNLILKKDTQMPFIPFLVLGFLFEFFLNISSKVFS
ncbi:peptidase A24 N-terminal domain-containing protein, putative prepilin signal peptidase [Malaciobacter molluscorum LMG 25693]|uniref:Peptidase A24 N-terminal domain-containing protein, putative prepilin signal peptidase n=1 Tax=Malaciobacter molluscorum LMG 25693 TaxID=870501 RepID=A0AB33GQI3_9BACT|nr:A24 family peptidase [Malaciobacter molluscorum]AXX93531.1 peptidase A24 N-terminal domain-containing protein, putative prepilin signal peptidase [Malaciobacter molluscorum LMG 25693]